MAIIIPKREYLTFAELLQRWQCTANDLRYLVVNGELKPSIKAVQELAIASWEYDVLEGICVPDGEVTDGQFGYTLKWHPAYWLYLQSQKQTGAMSCEFRLATRERDPKTPEAPWEDADTWFWLPKVIRMADIENESFFTMDEVLKYEVAHDQEAPLKQEEKPLATKERNTLLAIIAALCKEAKIDYTKPSKAAEILLGMADEMGLSISKRGIEEHLKKIPDSLASRMK